MIYMGVSGINLSGVFAFESIDLHTLKYEYRPLEEEEKSLN